MRLKIISFMLATVMCFTSVVVYADEDRELNLPIEEYDFREEMQREAEIELSQINLKQIIEDYSFSSLNASENNIYVVNEYDMLEELDRLPTQKLKDNGLSDDEIERLRDYRNVMSETIIEISNLDENKLEQLGYNDSQISIIKNFTGSDEDLRSISATCTGKISVDKHIYDT